MKKIFLLCFLASSSFSFAQKRTTQFSIAAESAVMATEQANKVYNLGFEIAQKIQTDMIYPGQIKVTVIREKRAVNLAR